MAGELSCGQKAVHAQRQTANAVDAVRQARLFGTPHALARMRADLQLLAMKGSVKGSNGSQRVAHESRGQGFTRHCHYYCIWTARMARCTLGDPVRQCTTVVLILFCTERSVVAMASGFSLPSSVQVASRELTGYSRENVPRVNGQNKPGSLGDKH